MPEFDTALVLTILAVGGIGVAGLTEMIKRFFKVEDVWGYIISGAVSIGATLFVLITGDVFSILNLVIYSVVVFLQSNGIYKFVAKT